HRAEPDHMPVVVDLVLASRHQERADVGRLARRERRHDTGEHGPVAEIAPAGERPAAAQAKATVGARDRAGPCERRRHLDARVLAADVFLSFGWKESQVPVVNADDARDPRARAAHRADLDDRLVERSWIELIATVSSRLQAAEDARFLEVLERLVR